MKATETFTQVIKSYLENRASTDAPFSEAFKKADRNIDDCVTYILNEVKKSGCNGFADQEIFDMAVHYYEADKIEVGDRNINANVIVNHHIDKPKVEPKPEAKPKAKITSKKADPKPTTPAPMSVVKSVNKYFANKEKEEPKGEEKPKFIELSLFD